MVSSLHGFYNAHRSLLVNQAALNVINSNVSNMNTEGYSKQRVDLSEMIINDQNLDNPYIAAASNGGVQIDAITRNRDLYYDNYFRTENSDMSYFSELRTLTSNIEDITNELDGNGIAQALDDFYTAAHELSNNPTDLVTRTNFLQTAISLSAMFNETTNQLDQMKTSLVGDISNPLTIADSKVGIYTNDLNNKLEELAYLNKNIAIASNQDTQPNALLDERDRLLDSISEYIPITVEHTANNQVNVSTNNLELVLGIEKISTFVAESNTATDPVIVRVQDNTGFNKITDVRNLISTGKLAATLEVGSSDVDKLTIYSIQSQLDTLAQEFAREVNDIQMYTTGGPPPTENAMCIDGSTNPPTLKLATEPIFLDQDNPLLLNPNNITAGNIRVNTNVINDPYEVATARTAVDNGSGTPLPADINATGDNSNILLTAQLRNKSLAALNSSTAEGYLTSMVGKMGVKSESIKNNFEAQTAVLDQIKLKRESIIGVNLDEELVDLVKFQRAYEASSRIFNVQNEILKKIIQLGG